MESRERLGSRLGFILLSAGCAIGCGNVWKFPTMCGANGGGGFVLIYMICLLLLGLPIMTMEFAVGRAAQASPMFMYQKLEKKGQKWHIHGYASLLGNLALMAFYTVVTGWIIYYFYKFLIGQTTEADGLTFNQMISTPSVNVIFLAVTVVVAFAILCFKLQGGLERVTKVMMVALLVLMLVLAIRSAFLPNAVEGIKFYLLPDFTKINGGVVVAAMNQAFFTLSVGIGSMAIFGSYIGKERSLMGESVNIIALDTFVALVAGFIIFPTCTSNGLEVDGGPGLLFNTMATAFNNMGPTGRIAGTGFFLFMVFAAMSTVLAVCENILAMVREITGWSRLVCCLICGAVVFCMALTTALGYSVFAGFEPLRAGNSWLDLWDFIVSTNLLPLGALTYVLFCSTKLGWGWDNFVAEANAGAGIKVQKWMKPICRFILPIIIIFLYVYGLLDYFGIFHI